MTINGKNLQMCIFHQAHEIKYLSPCCIWFGENHGKTVDSSLYNETLAKSRVLAIAGSLSMLQG